MKSNIAPNATDQSLSSAMTGWLNLATLLLAAICLAQKISTTPLDKVAQASGNIKRSLCNTFGGCYPSDYRSLGPKEYVKPSPYELWPYFKERQYKSVIYPSDDEHKTIVKYGHSDGKYK